MVEAGASSGEQERGPMSMFDREVGQGMFVACGFLRLGGLDDIDE